MVEVCVGPSELHLKKELTALRKARFLRDPETCSSYRSPLSSKSFAPSNNIIKNNNNIIKSNGTPKRKKVYLYNWRKSSERSEEEESLGEEESIQSKSDSCPKIETPVRRTLRRAKKSSVYKKNAIRNVSKLLLETVSNSNNNSNNISSINVRNNNLGENSDNNNNNSRNGSPFFSGSCGSWSNPARILRNMRRERENSSLSCTPVSTSSYYGHGASFDADDLLENNNKKGCGIPCYFAKRSGFYSNSPSLCGVTSVYKRPNSSNKSKYLKNDSSPVLPLLRNGGVQSEFDSESDEISTNFGELDLEAVSRLDGKRWSTSCKSIECYETGTAGTTSQKGFDAEQRSLTQKYRPKSFDEIIGQNLITQSLSNAILRGKIAPAYLFQGPRGTGTTKPCNTCTSCLNPNPHHIIEIDATNKKSMSKILQTVKNSPNGSVSTRYTVFIIDECHMVSSKTWSSFLKLLDEPLPRVVFVLVAVESENIPRAIISRCQRFVFGKIKEVDVICRLRRILVSENLDADLDALDLIAVNCEGSLRDAETMLDQLSLLGKKITANLVNDLVGVVSDEKLLDLLELAMSSDTAETVKRSRELMDSGIDPMALMSQLAGLIMDIIAGTYRLASSKRGGSGSGRNLTEGELERLQQALKILSDAEKQIRLSSERSTWFTAVLLQLGSSTLSEASQSQSRSTSSKQSVSRALTESTQKNNSCESERRRMERRGEEEGERMEEIWRMCIERCHSNSLRVLLAEYGKLVSMNENKGVIIAVIAFENPEIKSRAERYLSSITDSIETVVRRTVQVQLTLKTGIPFPASPNTGNQIPVISEGSSSQKRTNQRLENAWLQTGIVKPEKNQVLPAVNGVAGQKRVEHAVNGVAGQKRVELSELSEDLIREIRDLRIEVPIPGLSGTDERGRGISPSLLHSRKIDEMGYESGPGCNGLLCWRTQRPRVRKANQGTNVESNKSSGLSLFGPCGKPKVKESRLKKST
ncbi:hypothetical protein LUZ60_007643 [Juncus effusus]|nr:hypothetical protein LUZ60_007643 [Juncus effusus]